MKERLSSCQGDGLIMLRSCVSADVEKEWLLQADKDPKRTSSSTMDCLKRNKGEVLPWLSVFCLKSVA